MSYRFAIVLVLCAALVRPSFARPTVAECVSAAEEASPVGIIPAAAPPASFTGRLRAKWQNALGVATKDLSHETFMLFERVRKNPDDLPPPEEMEKHYARMREESGVWKGDVVAIFNQYRQAAQFTRDWNHFRAMLYRSEIHRPWFNAVRNMAESAGDVIALARGKGPAGKTLPGELGNLAYQTLLAIPMDTAMGFFQVPHLRAGFKTWVLENELLLKKVCSDPKFIKNLNLEKEVERYQQEAELFGETYARYRLANKIAGAAVVTAMAALVAAASTPDRIEKDKEVPPETQERFLADLNIPLEAKFIFTAGEPSYPVLYADSTYYIFDELDNPPHVLALNEHDFKELEKGQFLNSFAGGTTELKLNLSEEEVMNLSDRITDRVGKKHAYLPPFHTGTSGATEILSEFGIPNVPPPFRGSKTATLAWYRAQRALGNDKIGEIVLKNKEDSDAKGLLKNTFLNYWEASIYLQKQVLVPNLLVQPVADSLAVPWIERRINPE